MNTLQNYDFEGRDASPSLVLAHLPGSIISNLSFLDNIYGEDLTELVINQWLTDVFQYFGETSTREQRINMVIIHDLLITSLRLAISMRDQISPSNN